uniref:Uncharacterized protein n=1 Tax=Lotharella oceanica TaxID=641309 RepID=A0A7S2TSR6_9EUKA|mmetsp:Transcript_28319/g.52893  ORF Transcript_28319/g.52893 Transcript_28319/m.52893 type:complete len:114 (+) Transcript_28319:158-499(+)
MSRASSRRCWARTSTNGTEKRPPSARSINGRLPYHNYGCIVTFDWHAFGRYMQDFQCHCTVLGGCPDQFLMYNIGNNNQWGEITCWRNELKTRVIDVINEINIIECIVIRSLN